MANLRWIGWLASLGMAAALAATSHAGEQGLLSFAYWSDLLHLVLATLWLGDGVEGGAG